MRKEIWLLCLPLLLLGGCGTQEKAQDPPQIITRKTVQEAKKAGTPPEAKETPAPEPSSPWYLDTVLVAWRPMTISPFSVAVALFPMAMVLAVN